MIPSCLRDYVTSVRNQVIYPRIVLTAEIDVVVVLHVAAITAERLVISLVTVPVVDPAAEDVVAATEPVIIVNK